MSFSAESPRARQARFDGVSAEELAHRLLLPRVELFDEVGSTLDAAHRIAPDAPNGTLVLADQQTAGRGRQGHRWTSASGAGLWLTMIERPTDAHALDVLSLRCGLHAAAALDSLADAPIGLKWPNDLFVGARKLAGILIETRWRGTAPDWVAIGFGLNVIAPALDSAVGLRNRVTRLEALERLVPALRAATAASRHLSEDELTRWRARDVAAGRRLATPAIGVAAGISPAGALLIEHEDGHVSHHRTGSLTFADSPPCS